MGVGNFFFQPLFPFLRNNILLIYMALPMFRSRLVYRIKSWKSNAHRVRAIAVFFFFFFAQA